MAQKTQVTVSFGPPLFLLFLVFLVLKLTGVIAWSWWWVTAPIWIPVLFFVGIVGIMLLIGLVVAIIAGIVAVVKR